jgi:DNA polymerase-3 subunit delta
MNLFAFLGNDELRRQEALDAEVAAWQRSAGDGGECIREVYFGEEMRWEAVAESYRTADLFAPRKAIVIKGWDKVPAAQAKHLEEAFREDNPQVMVFLSAEKWDARSKLYKAVAAAKRVQEFKLPYDNQIPQWLTQRASQKYQRKLGFPEAKLLQEMVGDDTLELDHELEKLDTFLPKGAPIAATDIEDLASPLKEVGIFEMQRVIGHQKKLELLPALKSILDNDAPAFLVAQQVFKHCLTMLKIRAMMDAGQSQQDIIDTLKLHPFIHIKKEGYLEQARTRSTAKWKQILIRLARLESELKQGRFSHRFEVEMAFAAMV